MGTPWTNLRTRSNRAGGAEGGDPDRGGCAGCRQPRGLRGGPPAPRRWTKRPARSVGAAWGTRLRGTGLRGGGAVWDMAAWGRGCVGPGLRRWRRASGLQDGSPCRVHAGTGSGRKTLALLPLSLHPYTPANPAGTAMKQALVPVSPGPALLQSSNSDDVCAPRAHYPGATRCPLPPPGGGGPSTPRARAERVPLRVAPLSPAPSSLRRRNKCQSHLHR